MIRVAIDGPSGAGKSTVAKRIAKDLSIIYVDTGAMYRCIGLYALRQGLDTKDSQQVSSCLEQIHLETSYDVQNGQRIFLNGEDVRDIGTVVIPDAELKIFLTASPESRARRRYLEYVQKGQQPVYDDILRDVILRDHQDSTRAAAPLCQAPDAVKLDTTEINFEDTVSIIKEMILKKAAELSLSI